MLLRIDDLHREARQRTSTTDKLSCRTDFGNLLGYARFSEGNRVLIDGNDVAATEGHCQRILRQPVSDKKAFRLQSVRLKSLQEAGVGVRFDGFCRDQQLPQRAEIAG